ncbi:MAG: N-acetylmuramidase family protein [Rhizobiaceae bacterium]|nr:N-acetylmuramidase family protein [Rhizobiaceae bacterium]
MVSKEVAEAIMAAAAEFAIEAAALAAIAELESGGVAHAAFDGRREPLVRFEGHYFDRRLAGEKRAQARAQGLSSPTAGKVPNPAGQAARWRLLDRAAEIDRKAAFESTSWGLGQVMGAHWAWLGYASVDAFAAEARSGARGQARQMARYIAKAGLAAAIARRDWAAVARGYNGPGYAKNRYDKRLAAAFARHAAVAALREGSGAPMNDLPGTVALPKRGPVRRWWDFFARFR